MTHESLFCVRLWCRRSLKWLEAVQQSTYRGDSTTRMEKAQVYLPIRPYERIPDGGNTEGQSRVWSTGEVHARSIHRRRKRFSMRKRRNHRRWIANQQLQQSFASLLTLQSNDLEKFAAIVEQNCINFGELALWGTLCLQNKHQRSWTFQDLLTSVTIFDKSLSIDHLNVVNV
jgi:hypothetical protein